jgi:hypothetical protein
METEFSINPCWNPLEFLLEGSVTVEGDKKECQLIQQDAKSYLERYTINANAFDRSSKEVRGSETGDDCVNYSQNPFLLAITLSTAQRICHMKISWEDTVISAFLWNYCEVTSIVPVHPGQSFDLARKTNDSKEIGFIDVVSERIKQDVSKGNVSDFGSTTIGKVQWMRPRVTMPRTDLQGDILLANFLQDGLLRADKSPDPKYLHTYLGGTGVLGQFPGNVYLYVKAYKCGSYQRIYGSAVAELRQVVRDLDDGKPHVPLICRWLRQKQEYLWATYAERVFVPKDLLKSKTIGDLPIPLYEKLSNQVYLHSVEERLVRARELIPRHKALLEVLYSRRLKEVLKSGTVVLLEKAFSLKSKEERSRFDMALRANAAIQNLLKRTANDADVRKLLGDDFYSVNTGRLTFDKDDADWLNNPKGITFGIDDVSFPEDMYVREEVSAEESLKVSGIPLRTLVHGKLTVRETTTRLGLYQISASMKDWAQRKLKDLIQLGEEYGRPIPPQNLLRPFTENLEWVNDDNGLIAKSLSEMKDEIIRPIWLISSDRRLAARMAKTINCKVYRLEPITLITRSNQRLWTEETIPSTQELEILMKDILPPGFIRPTKVLMDTGSLSSAASRAVKEYGKTYFHDWNGYERSGTDLSIRTVTSNLKEVDRKKDRIEQFVPFKESKSDLRRKYFSTS